MSKPNEKNNQKIPTGIKSIDEWMKGGLAKGETPLIPTGLPSYKTSHNLFYPPNIMAKLKKLRVNLETRDDK